MLMFRGFVWLSLKIGDPKILHPVAVRIQCRAHLCYLLHLIKKSCFLPGGSSLDCWAETKTCEISWNILWLDLFLLVSRALSILAEVLVSTWRVHNDQVILFLLEKFHTCQCGATLLGWVSASLPPKVASLPPQSSLDPSHCSRHRKVFSPWPVHWQHPKASEGNRRLNNNSRLSLHVKRRTMSYVLAETSDHLVIMLSSSCRSHHLVVFFYGSKPIAKPWYHGEHQNINR